MKKPLKVAAWSGILGLILGIILNIIYSILSIKEASSTLMGALTITTVILTIPLFIFFYYGYIALGNKLNNNFLKVMAWIGIVIFILVGVFTLIIGIISISVPSVNAQEIGQSSYPDFKALVISVFLIIWVIWIFATLPAAIYLILFGIAQRKNKDQVELAGISGTFKIIAGATLFLFIGILFSFISFIMDIVMFFKASKKFE